MEIDRFHINLGATKNDSTHQKNPIHVRAIISCPKCKYKKTFKNQFLRRDMELMKTSLLVFDWLTCDKCGELLNLELEFQI